MVPIDLGEHDIAGKHHHFRSGFRLLIQSDRFPIRINAETAHQSLTIEITTIGNASMQAITVEVVEFVDIDRSR